MLFSCCATWSAIVFRISASPTHGLFRFQIDDCISVVPLKRVTKPGVQDLVVGSQCSVKWSTTGKPLATTLLALGKSFILVDDV